MPQTQVRCPWAASDPLYHRYHDREWGVPVRNDRKLFEFLILEGAQAGLAWITVLRKRPAYRAAFDNFDYQKVARYNSRKIASLLKDSGIIRNELKIRSAVRNARAFLEVRREFGTFSKYMWSFVDGAPIQNRRLTLKDLPPRTEVSDALSKDLKERGFNFVGSTICYAHMQAIGMVNDHLLDCFRYREVAALGAARKP